MKSKAIYLSATLALLTFNSCGFIIKSYIRKDTDNVPPDFGKEKTTLLVIQGRNHYTKKVESIIKKNYTGEYILIKSDELNTKYKDTVTYRYYFDDHVSISQTQRMVTNPATGRQSFSTSSAGSRSFNITDRKTKKIHGTGISSGTSWKKILKVYMKKLDSERKKNGGN